MLVKEPEVHVQEHKEGKESIEAICVCQMGYVRKRERQ